MQITYKKVPTLQPHCGDCKEQLMGDGSMGRPYNCSCGEWDYTVDGKDYRVHYYKLKKSGNPGNSK